MSVSSQGKEGSENIWLKTILWTNTRRLKSVITITMVFFLSCPRVGSISKLITQNSVKYFVYAKRWRLPWHFHWPSHQLCTSMGFHRIQMCPVILLVPLFYRIFTLALTTPRLLTYCMAFHMSPSSHCKCLPGGRRSASAKGVFVALLSVS